MSECKREIVQASNALSEAQGEIKRFFIAREGRITDPKDVAELASLLYTVARKLERNIPKPCGECEPCYRAAGKCRHGWESVCLTCRREGREDFEPAPAPMLSDACSYCIGWGFVATFAGRERCAACMGSGRAIWVDAELPVHGNGSGEALPAMTTTVADEAEPVDWPTLQKAMEDLRKLPPIELPSQRCFLPGGGLWSGDPLPPPYAPPWFSGIYVGMDT